MSAFRFSSSQEDWLLLSGKGPQGRHPECLGSPHCRILYGYGELLLRAEIAYSGLLISPIGGTIQCNEGGFKCLSVSKRKYRRQSSVLWNCALLRLLADSSDCSNPAQHNGRTTVT